MKRLSKRWKIIFSISAGLLLLTHYSRAGLFYDEDYDNSRYQSDFNDSDHKIFGTLMAVCGVNINGDPTPPISSLFNGSLFTLDAGFQKVLWPYFDPANQLFSIYNYGDDGSLAFPRAIVSNQNGEMYIADTGHHRIAKFLAAFGGNGLRLTKVKDIGGLGRDNGTFISPMDVAVTNNTNSHFYVADYGNSRIQEFDTDGNFIRVIGSYGTGPCQFVNPEGRYCQMLCFEKA
jgi:hypothetical protein